MPTTKGDIVNNAYGELRISGITTQPSPADQSFALGHLEDMMAEFDGRNICLNYNFEEPPDPATLTGVLRFASAMMKWNLATRLIPSFDKKVPVELGNFASSSLSTVSSIVEMEGRRQIQASNRMPVGSGNHRQANRYRRFNRTAPLPPNECATNKITVGEINDYEESFAAYLGLESIVSFVITADPGLFIVSSANNSPVINYRIRVDESATTTAFRQVKFIITTNTGRINEVIVNFEVEQSVELSNA